MKQEVKTERTPETRSSLRVSVMLCLSVMLVALTGCEAPQSNIERRAQERAQIEAAADKLMDVAEATGEAPKLDYQYSPFVLDVKHSSSVFKRISFKDVGVRFGKEQRKKLYEKIAQTLASELGADTNLSMPASVVYDEAILDPLNHLACGSEHLYVDVWQSEQPSRWGYSLWSGCGEEDNFAWKEIAFTHEENGDLGESIKPLAQSIVSSLKEANARGCYQKTC